MAPAGAISPAAGSARSSRSRKSAPTRAGSTITRTRSRPSRAILYAAYPDERFSHFRKTDGYANLPLDGIWLRAPYLHNGSVPTVRDLLEPAENRPKVFYRGYDVIDQRRLGFVADVAEEGGRQFFRYETQCIGGPEKCAGEPNTENRHDDNICVPGKWAGNSNRGHDGAPTAPSFRPPTRTRSSNI